MRLRNGKNTSASKDINLRAILKSVSTPVISIQKNPNPINKNGLVPSEKTKCITPFFISNADFYDIKNKKDNCEFHALTHLSSSKGVSSLIIIGCFSSLEEGKKHSGRFFPAFCNFNKYRMFFEAFMSLSIQHNLHSLRLQRITLLI
jgi:hypothetical protein